MSETQKTITAWGDQTFGPTHPAAIARRMRHEVNELLEAFALVGDTPVDRLPLPTLRALREECADIYVMLAQVAEKLGADVAVEATFKMRVNRGRRWARDPVSGTVRHVTTFKEKLSRLEMDIRLWYVIGDTGKVYHAEGFPSARDAHSWTLSPEGIAAGAGGAVVPTLLETRDGWKGLGAVNVFFARDLWDLWDELSPRAGLGGVS